MDLAEVRDMKAYLYNLGDDEHLAVIALAHITELENELRHCLKAYDQRDAALAWAALWKRAAIVNRAGRHFMRWTTARRDLTKQRTREYWRSLHRALGLCHD